MNPAFRKYLKRNSPFRRIILLVAMPLMLTSTAYALYSQQLTIRGNAVLPSYTSSQNLSVNYSKTVTSNGGVWQYDIAVTVKYNGTGTISAWQSTFSLPSGYSNISCTSANCAQTDDINTADNTNSNGTIEAGGTVSYSFSFQYSTQTYQFTSITVSGTLVPVYQDVTGLTVSANAGTRTQSGAWYTWPYTLTVTNNSGGNLNGWQVLVPWDPASNQVNSMPSSVNYVTNSTQLIITGTQTINNAENYQFTADLSSTDPNWVMTGYSIQGQVN